MHHLEQIGEAVGQMRTRFEFSTGNTFGQIWRSLEFVSDAPGLIGQQFRPGVDASMLACNMASLPAKTAESVVAHAPSVPRLPSFVYSTADRFLSNASCEFRADKWLPETRNCWDLSIENFSEISWHKLAQTTLAQIQMGKKQDVTLQQAPSMEIEIVKFHGDAYDIEYDRHGGPRLMGQILIAPHGPRRLTSTDVREFLDAVASLDKHVCEKDFVAIFDISQYVRPSILSLPLILTVARDRLPPATLRDHTQAFAVVGCEAGSLRTLVDVVLGLTKPENPPVFAPGREAAKERLNHQFERTP